MEFVYSVSDIDRMRAAIRRRPSALKNYRNPENTHGIEQLLRTYMMAGVTPDALEQAADDEWADIHARQETRKALSELDRDCPLPQEIRRKIAFGEAACKTADAAAREITRGLPSDWSSVVRTRVQTLVHRLLKARR